MRVFKDKADDKWQIDLPFGTVKRVKAESEGKYDLLEPWKKDGGDGLQTLLWADLAEFFELLWYIVEPQAKERGINAEKFGDLMAGECVIAARDVFFEEWTDFFRQLQRTEVATALEKMRKYNAKAVELVKAKMADQKMTDLDQRVTTKLESALTKSYGSLQDSLDAILSDSLGDN